MYLPEAPIAPVTLVNVVAPGVDCRKTAPALVPMRRILSSCGAIAIALMRADRPTDPTLVIVDPWSVERYNLFVPK